MSDIGRIGAEHALRNCDLHGMKAPGTHAAKKEGIAELVFARNDIGNVAERAVERKDAIRHTCIDHASERVVPEVLLVDRAIAFDISVNRILTNQVARVAAANTLFIGSGNQLGEFESGVTAAAFGPVASVVLGGLGTICVSIAWAKLFKPLAQRQTLA